MRFCKDCGGTGPFYEKLRRNPERLEFTTRCKECERRHQRDRYAGRRKVVVSFDDHAVLYRQELERWKARRAS